LLPLEERSEVNIYKRVIDTLTGKKPDRLAFIDRLELWYSCHSRAGSLPLEFKQDIKEKTSSPISLFTVPVSQDLPILPLTEVHRRVGIGQQLQMILHARKLRGVELVMSLNGEEFCREIDPVVEYFPRLFDKMFRDQPGETVAKFITPKGVLTTRTVLSPENVVQGAVPMMNIHPIKGPEDYPAFEYIFEHAEYIPEYSKVEETQAHLGEFGFVVPMLNRIPFQQLALDHVGEISFFYMLYDYPDLIEKMLNLLDQVMMEDFQQVSSYTGIYVQFDDNMDGMITNPRLFKSHCLPYYQQYTEILHAQGKKIGSHMDGNLKQLLAMLAESGLDVCESFSPAPLTGCTFDEAWQAWQERGPMIWGGIPSPLLEPQTSESDFHNFVDHVLHLAQQRPMILGIGDFVMPNNLIERARWIAERVEELNL
jgi:hypothetical protein